MNGEIKIADYRKMYYRMVDASERALELLEQRREDFREQFLWQQLTDLLRQAELDCEDLYMQD